MNRKDFAGRMGGITLVLALVLPMLFSSCLTTALKQPTYDDQGNPIVNPDGTPRTVGGNAADALDANSSAIAGTIGKVVTVGTGNPIIGTGAAGAMLALLLAGGKLIRNAGRVTTIDPKPQPPPNAPG